jgi:hypothetical protein
MCDFGSHHVGQGDHLLRSEFVAILKHRASVVGGSLPVPLALIKYGEGLISYGIQ